MSARIAASVLKDAESAVVLLDAIEAHPRECGSRADDNAIGPA